MLCGWEGNRGPDQGRHWVFGRRGSNFGEGVGNGSPRWGPGHSPWWGSGSKTPRNRRNVGNCTRLSAPTTMLILTRRVSLTSVWVEYLRCCGEGLGDGSPQRCPGYNPWWEFVCKPPRNRRNIGNCHIRQLRRQCSYWLEESLYLSVWVEYLRCGVVGMLIRRSGTTRTWNCLRSSESDEMRWDDIMSTYRQHWLIYWSADWWIHWLIDWVIDQSTGREGWQCLWGIWGQWGWYIGLMFLIVLVPADLGYPGSRVFTWLLLNWFVKQRIIIKQ